MRYRVTPPMRTRARGRRLLLTGIAAVAATTVLAGTASGERAVAVSLSVAGNASPSVATTKGKAVALVARGALHAGDRLLIAVTRGSGRRLLGVTVCSHSPCTGRWVERSAISDRFQAFVTHGSGKSFSVHGRSRVVRVTWKAPPPPPPPPPLPPPPPPATPGHYQGRSSFNETFDFDVTADGKSVANLQTGQINESCTPPANISGGNLTAAGPFAIAADGSFSIGGTLPITVNSSSGSRKVTITGRFTGGTATGTIRTDTTFTLDGTAYTCTSGDQTWTATKT
jgi:hypothetical protein